MGPAKPGARRPLRVVAFREGEKEKEQAERFKEDIKAKGENVSRGWGDLGQMHAVGAGRVAVRVTSCAAARGLLCWGRHPASASGYIVTLGCSTAWV